ncbi:hypothetical protein C8Q75DRAFT_738076 [Abortiporus biennis]|nr:hypothetical protein C8Q75DRAFT_738076 [Abortiporus biennis]
MVRRADKRIFLSSLYLGSEEAELINVLHATLRQKPHLQLRMHLDLNRSTRPGPSSTANILLPLLKDFPDRVHISMFRSPKLKGVMAKVVPPRFNEGWGTWHPKIYGADDELLISGANLNESYFTNRQDRYIYLSYQPHLAQYCHAFLQTASSFSYQLLPSESSPQGYDLHWSDTNIHPHHIESKARNALSTFQETYRLSATFRIPEKETIEVNPKDDCLIFPIIQGGQFGIREEERAMSLLFKSFQNTRSTSFSNGPVLDLTTGYFGLYRPYRDLVLQSPVTTRIVASAPKANGFYGSRGLSGRLPEAYTLLEQRFMRAVRAAGRGGDPHPHHPHIASSTTDLPSTSSEKEPGQLNPGVELSEWERDGWTYHAKGIWLRPTPTSTPYLTLFGSTNLNSRSANLDTELSFLLVTTSNSLRDRLAEEVDGLREYSRPWRGAERKVRVGTKALVAIMGGML